MAVRASPFAGKMSEAELDEVLQQTGFNVHSLTNYANVQSAVMLPLTMDAYDTVDKGVRDVLRTINYAYEFRPGDEVDVPLDGWYFTMVLAEKFTVFGHEIDGRFHEMPAGSPGCYEADCWKGVWSAHRKYRQMLFRAVRLRPHIAKPVSLPETLARGGRYKVFKEAYSLRPGEDCWVVTIDGKPRQIAMNDMALCLLTDSTGEKFSYLKLLQIGKPPPSSTTGHSSDAKRVTKTTAAASPSPANHTVHDTVADTAENVPHGGTPTVAQDGARGAVLDAAEDGSRGRVVDAAEDGAQGGVVDAAEDGTQGGVVNVVRGSALASDGAQLHDNAAQDNDCNQHVEPPDDEYGGGGDRALGFGFGFGDGPLDGAASSETRLAAIPKSNPSVTLPSCRTGRDETKEGTKEATLRRTRRSVTQKHTPAVHLNAKAVKKAVSIMTARLRQPSNLYTAAQYRPLKCSIDTQTENAGAHVIRKAVSTQTVRSGGVEWTSNMVANLLNTVRADISNALVTRDATVASLTAELANTRAERRPLDPVMTETAALSSANDDYAFEEVEQENEMVPSHDRQGRAAVRNLTHKFTAYNQSHPCDSEETPVSPTAKSAAWNEDYERVLAEFPPTFPPVPTPMFGSGSGRHERIVRIEGTPSDTEESPDLAERNLLRELREDRRAKQDREDREEERRIADDLRRQKEEESMRLKRMAPSPEKTEYIRRRRAKCSISDLNVKEFDAKAAARSVSRSGRTPVGAIQKHTFRRPTDNPLQVQMLYRAADDYSGPVEVVFTDGYVGLTDDMVLSACKGLTLLEPYTAAEIKRIGQLYTDRFLRLVVKMGKRALIYETTPTSATSANKGVDTAMQLANIQPQPLKAAFTTFMKQFHIAGVRNEDVAMAGMKLLCLHYANRHRQALRDLNKESASKQKQTPGTTSDTD